MAQRFRKATRQADRQNLTEMAEEVPDARDLVESGHDPLHAAYIQAQNFTSVFAEAVSAFKELDEYAELVGRAEDEYLPGGPPMSPLTTSYFTTWAFYDLRLGPDRETIGTCVLDLANVLGLEEFQSQTIHNFQQSRMGIYEHLGDSESQIRLRELVTGREFDCHPTSGYRGKEGELWYVRVCAPLSSLVDLPDYHIILTTPTF